MKTFKSTHDIEHNNNDAIMRKLEKSVQSEGSML